MAASLHFSPLISGNVPNQRNLSRRNGLEQARGVNFSMDLDSFKACRNMDEVQQFHCHQMKKGLDHRLSPVTDLIASCVEVGDTESLNHARKAFDIFRMDKRTTGTVFMHNCLIRGYAFVGLGDEAIRLYVQMLGEGLLPDKFTFPFVLSACAKSLALHEGSQVHGLVFKMGMEEDLFIGNSLIHFYAECGELGSSTKVFDEMTERNVVSWTSLISGYLRLDVPREAIDLFFRMLNAGERPNPVTMVCAISACGKLQDLDLGKRICTNIGEMGMKSNAVLTNALVEMYMKCGATEEAKRIFDESDDKNLVLYNIVMSNYSDKGLTREVFCILDGMLAGGLKPDKVTMLSALSASAQSCDLLMGRCCHGYALRNALTCWDNVVTAIIDMYAKCGKLDTASRVFELMQNKTTASWNSVISGYVRNGDLDSARLMFNMMPERNIVSWNTMIGALVQEEQFQEAVEFFRVMRAEGVKADRVTLMCVSLAAGHMGALELAKWILRYISNSEIICDIKLKTALVDMFGRCGDHKTAMQLFSEMKIKDVSAWTAAIGSAAMVGDGEHAVQLFNEMVEQNISLDAVVFVKVLTACSHGGLVKQGIDIFQSMEDVHKISPQIEHYGCVVDLLGRAGLLEDAVDLIRNMPIEPNEIVWGSFLAACRIHKNLELAIHADEQMTKRNWHRIGTQVLLSNIYASAGKWTDVAEVRLRLKEKGLQKIPGLSWIEVDGELHEFVSGDEFNQSMMNVELKLDEINSRLTATGCLHDLSNVLLYVD
uniref:Chlororespiratory reduction 21 n=1 Tax=Kalanchoe fedtschenkoi TaxID=63787 RepID=A0A7N0VIP0_KALFE